MKILGISGRKQSGKDTLKNYLVEHSPRLFPYKTVRSFAFADPLKETVQLLTGCHRIDLWGTDENKNQVCEATGDTHRMNMLKLGAKIDEWWPNCFNACMTRKLLEYRPDIAIITDVRKVSELELIHKLGGKAVRLHRNPYAGQQQAEIEVRMEAALDYCGDFDLHIPEDATIKDMCLKTVANLAIWEYIKCT
jgi:hypothetical protein